MIEVTDLKKNFQSFQALKGISLHVEKGEIYGFIGKNGAGKTTTMNILTGLSRPNSGTCLVGGQDVTRVAHPSVLDIGYLPEDPKFYPWMTAMETLAYLGGGQRRPVDRNRINEMLAWVGLCEAANRRVGGFSRGMRQRLGIAAALIHDPMTVILDEPSSALDPEGRSDVLRLIIDLKQMGKTVIFSTHILSDVQRVCDTVGIIADGRMLTEKPLAEIVKENIVPVYDIQLAGPIAKDLASRLLEITGVRLAEISNGTLSVTVTDAQADALHLLRFLCDNNQPVQSFVLRRNDLENIFIQEVNGK